MGTLLGCIADDFTGGTDLAAMLVRNGMRAVQVIGVPAEPVDLGDADAVVVALKSRTAPVREAVADSLAALEWLRRTGCVQFYFKYCSTFDSTPGGNIGPVADALMDALDVPYTVACPAFPAAGRTVYKGHLFVGDRLLSESGMRHHPLTPMTDSDLVRVLQLQTRRKVGLVDAAVVVRGAEAIRSRLEELAARGFGIAVTDATEDAHLRSLGEACAGLGLVTGGSGAAMGLPANFRRTGALAGGNAAELPAAAGHRAVVSGSCSAATNAQVAAMAEERPVFRVDPLALAAGEDLVGQALEWARPRLADGPVLVAATALPDDVGEVQRRLGAGRAGALVEDALAAIAVGLVRSGVGRMIVAGGETSGAVVKALGVRSLRIGAEIAPGVPWTYAEGDEGGLALALKSGNFGAPDFFLAAWDSLR